MWRVCMDLSLGCIAPHLIGLSTIVEGIPRHGTEGERMNSKRALSTSLSNKIQGYLTKCYWKARKQGNFMNSEGVHEYDSHILF